jgi:dCMP deaminase
VTNNVGMYLETFCDHKPEIPVTQNGVIIEWLCRCGQAINTFQDEVTKQVRLRPGPDQYFMSIALAVATRATCDRKHVGAILVRDKTILSTGYNGAPRGMKDCDQIGHMMEDGHCVRTTHAEANAIVQAAKNGTSVDGSTIYTTASPCWQCFKLIVNAGVKNIVFAEMYRDDRINDFAIEAGIGLQHLALDLWEDKPLPEDIAIRDVMPTNSGRHDLYEEAARMVGAKRSKQALISLVNWLLYKLDKKVA